MILPIFRLEDTQGAAGKGVGAPLFCYQKRNFIPAWHSSDLNDLCVGSGVSLEWVRSDPHYITTDPLTFMKATAVYGDCIHPLTSAGARRTLLDLHQYQQK